MEVKKYRGLNAILPLIPKGLPHAIEITTANVTDREGTISMASHSKENLSEVKTMLVDGGCTGEPFSVGIKGILGATVEVAKRSELHKFAVIPKRWVVEGSFG